MKCHLPDHEKVSQPTNEVKVLRFSSRNWTYL